MGVSVMNNDELEILNKRLNNAKEMYKKGNREEKIALSQYIDILFLLLNDIKYKNTITDNIHNKYNDYLKSYFFVNRKLINNFLKFQDYHNNFFEYIIQNEMELEKLYNHDIEKKQLKEKDFNDIFIEFTDSLGLSKLYKNLRIENRIHNIESIENIEDIGETLYNPINKDFDIFITNYIHNLDTMFVMSHEFGHVYDLSNFIGSLSDYQRYSYNSLFGETISTLFERIFLYYLINNNILKEEAKNKLLEVEMVSIYKIKSALMLTLLDKKYIKNEAYIYGDRSKIVEKCLCEFYDEYAVEDYLIGLRELNIKKDLTYTYGNILSLFMIDEVIDKGLSSKLLNNFMNIRTNFFNPDFFDNNNITPKEYNKLYKKELELVKK